MRAEAMGAMGRGAPFTSSGVSFREDWGGLKWKNLSHTWKQRNRLRGRKRAQEQTQSQELWPVGVGG